MNFVAALNTVTRNVEIRPLTRRTATATAKGKPQSLFTKLQKRFKKAYNAKVRELDKVCRERFGRYMVMDSYGTFQLTYSMKGAMEWLPYCSPDARIVCAETGRVMRARIEAEAV